MTIHSIFIFEPHMVSELSSLASLFLSCLRAGKETGGSADRRQLVLREPTVLECIRCSKPLAAGMERQQTPARS